MRLLTLWCIYVTIKFSHEKCLTNLSDFNDWEIKLKRYLYSCNLMKPVTTNKSEPLDVRLDFKLKSFNYMSAEQEFYIYTWTVISWEDEKLRWDPSKFNNIESTIRQGAQLWIPGIQLLNSIDEWNMSFKKTPCTIFNDGHIYCTTPLLFASKCVADLNEWPRDAQTCSVEIGEKYNVVNDVKIRLSFGHRAISMIGSEYGTEWDIMDYKQEVNQSSKIQLKMYFTLERHAEVLVAMVIYPSIVLSGLTLLTLVLDVRRDLRVFLACFSLMCHFYFLSDLALEIPTHSNNPPKILLYFRSSAIITAVNVAITFLLKILCRRDADVPAWMVNVNRKIFDSYVKFIIFPRWVTDDSSDEKIGNVRSWTDFSNIVNSVWCCMAVVDYIVFYCLFVPPERPW